MNINRLLKFPSDTTGTQLFINPNDRSYYFADQNSETATVIKKSDGSNLRQTTDIDEYDIFIDRKGIAIEKQQDGNYLLAIKMTAQPLDPSLVNLINGRQWILYTIGNDGIIKDERILSSIKSEESKFNQDVDGDEGEGLSIDILTKKESDTVGTQLFIDSDKFLYFADENSNKPIPIVDKDGDQLKDIYFSYEDNFDNKIAIAIEKQSDDNYLLAVRNKVKITSDIDLLKIDKTEWILYTIYQDGKIKDEKKLSSIEFKSEESKFNQDVDGDNIKGLTIDMLTKKESDTVGTQLFVNSNTNINQEGLTIKESALYFVDENDTIPKPIIDKDGEQLKEIYFSSDDYIKDLKAIAIEKQPNGNYLLAMIDKLESTDGNSQEYIIYTIDQYGKVIDQKKLSIKSIKSKELKFNQDVDGDNIKGLTKDMFTKRESDTVGTQLFVNSTFSISQAGATIREGGLYFVDENDTIPKPIIDKDGNQLKEKYVSSGGNVSDLKAIAIEKQPDGNYLLAMIDKLESTKYGNSQEYIIYTIDKDGKVIDKKKLSSIEFKSEESKFNQNVDGDNIKEGLSIDIFTKKESDTTGTKLFVNYTTSISQAGVTIREGALYFVDENDTIQKPIIDKDGDQLKEKYTSYGGNVSDLKAIAIEKQPDGNYLLAMINKLESTNGNSQEYIIYTIYQDGKVIDKKKLSSIEFKSEESKFNQNVDGDKGIGLSIDILAKKESDTTGTKLFVNYTTNNSAMGVTIREGDLYFVDENDTIPKPIIDKDGNQLKEKYTSSDDYVYEIKAIAIEKQPNGNYLLFMIRKYSVRFTWSEWLLYTIGQDGQVIGGRELRRTSSLRYNEYNFKQDLDNDGKIGYDLENIENEKTKLFVEVKKKKTKYGIITTDVFHLYFQPEDSQIPKPIIEKYSNDIFKLNVSREIAAEIGWEEGKSLNVFFPIAIEKLTEDARYKGKVIAEKGEYLLLIKEQFSPRDGKIFLHYDLYIVSSNGKIKSEPIYGIGKTDDINELEKYFGYDINNDLQYSDIRNPKDPINKGLNLINIKTDTSGVKLWINKNRYLFIGDQNNFIKVMPIRRKSTMKIEDIIFDYLEYFVLPPGGEDGGEDAYAVEKIQQDNITYRNQVIAIKGDYLLAVKNSLGAYFFNDSKWDLYVLENTGFDAILKKTLKNVPVKDFEKYFNQDLNEDGNIGRVTSKQNTRNQLKNKNSLKVHEVFTLHNKKTINMKIINMKTNH